MIASRSWACALALVALPAAALAQADTTGDGGGPLSTITAPNTNSLGVTKPPSRGAAPDGRDDPDRLTRAEREQNRIDTGICIGCGPK